jgi:hypothetical protein
VSGLLVGIRAHLVASRRAYPQIGTRLAISNTPQVVATLETRTTRSTCGSLPSLQAIMVFIMGNFAGAALTNSGLRRST